MTKGRWACHVTLYWAGGIIGSTLIEKDMALLAIAFGVILYVVVQPEWRDKP